MQLWNFTVENLSSLCWKKCGKKRIKNPAWWSLLEDGASEKHGFHWLFQLERILEKNGHGGEPETLFHYYLVTGGTPKYVELLLTEEAYKTDEIFNFIFSENSPFLQEGKNVLIEELGKEYGIYFSILELISNGKTSRTEVESILQKEIGGHLERLENFYGVIERFRPIHAKPQTKAVKYRIKDLFLRFWFRFIYRNWSAIETSNFAYV